MPDKAMIATGHRPSREERLAAAALKHYPHSQRLIAAFIQGGRARIDGHPLIGCDDCYPIDVMLAQDEGDAWARGELDAESGAESFSRWLFSFGATCAREHAEQVRRQA